MVRENLTGYLENLVPNDLHFICWAFGETGRPINLGQVAFVDKDLVLQALTKIQSHSSNKVAKRKAGKIRKKLLVKEDPCKKFEMFLNERSIFKYVRFNKQSESFEITLPYHIDQLVSMQWNEFKKAYVPVKVSIPCILILKRLGKNRFRCAVHKDAAEKATNFLFARYGVNRVFPKGL